MKGSGAQKEYQVILELSGDIPVALLCSKMGIRRSSFHYWKKRLAHSLSSKRGDRMTYLSGLQDLIGLKEQHPQYRTILHTDQGSVYASKAFNEPLPMYGITRSMSRAGTPTDNAAMESINGWIKAEIFRDFHVTGEADVGQKVDEYIRFFNEERPAYSLNYMTTKQYREAHVAERA